MEQADGPVVGAPHLSGDGYRGRLITLVFMLTTRRRYALIHG
jgi:hypothetical protein